MNEHGYVSYASCGVDAKKFYKDFHVTIAGVSRATGTSRKSVSKVPVEYASRENTEKIILYLEEVSADDYNYAIQQCRQDIITAFKKVDEAWQDYKRRESILDRYRCKYNISRKKPLAEKVTLWDVLKSVKRS